MDLYANPYPNVMNFINFRGEPHRTDSQIEEI